MRNRNYLLLVFLLFILSSCDDDESLLFTELVNPVKKDTMPAYTEIGSRTLAYKVNGRVIKTINELDSSNAISVIFINSPDFNFHLNIEARSLRKTNFEALVINLVNVIDTGMYYADDEYMPNSLQYIIGQNRLFNVAYVTNYERRGSVHIKKLDTINHIIAGTFAFKAQLFYIGTDRDTLEVREGQFDVKYMKL